jgi:ATP-dependent helicase/nuclease subunit A
MSDRTAPTPLLAALDPTRSVVVEACAGSGKTWLLASRIVRLLLAGVAPGEILAITFTRKAAREIEERVVAWLQLLATAGADEVSSFLAERGVALDDEVMGAARGLYERVLAAQPPLAVSTFHGWFLQLVDAAPLADKLAGATLVDSDSRHFDELWQSFAAALQEVPSSAATQAFVRLLDEAGMGLARRLVRRALARRSEWLAFGLGCGASDDAIAQEVVAALAAQLARGGAASLARGSAFADFFAADWSAEFAAYLDFLAQSTLASDLALAEELGRALVETDRARAFDGLRAVLLTKQGTLRKRSASAALDKRFGVVGAARFLELHERLGERLIANLERQLAERILEFNRDACAVFATFLAHVSEFKKARRQFDFVDAEWMVAKLLRDEASSAFMQARLDARYRQVLVDEFQDTNPLQWQILTAWLSSYSDASRPRVFVVGDPKQSIYRFRRAEPKLFSVAADFLVREYAAAYCERDETFRNAPAIVEVVNEVFLGLPEFTPFRRQTSLARALPGRVELMPLCARSSEPPPDEAATPREERGKREETPREEKGKREETPREERLRDPLSEPEVEVEDARLANEAQNLATKIREIVGAGAGGAAWQVEEQAAGGGRSQRGARYGDILLLVRNRTHVAIYERALIAADVPFDVASRGGLLGALEVRDLVALLEFLVSPVADLALAQALRSPLFACGDEDLMALAARDGRSWWQRLRSLVATGEASAAATRAEALLVAWLQAADRLPAHDLLDRIYHQGEAFARYRLAVPAAAAASVEANLRALVLLALDLDGGRYPSLPRFIDELRDLRDAEDKDAPDEGQIDAHDADAGRVRLLTIHSAKGLEAPIVWLLGANAAPRAQDPWDVLVDWPPAEEAPRHFSFFGRKEDRGAARQSIFEAELSAAKREELNLLYVALTRAKQVFIASGIENGRGDRGETPTTAYGLLEAALARLAGGLAHGDPLPLAPARGADAARAKESPAPPLPATGERRSAPDAGERFGILLHALLERRTGCASGTHREGWWRALGFDDAEYRRVVPVAERLLAAPDLRRFFDPARYLRAWNEVDVAVGDGSLRRVDRIVEFDDAIWVLDYKSSKRSPDGSARHADYEQQVLAYCRALAPIFPGSELRGALLFADGALVEVC